MIDSGASKNVMPYSVCKKLNAVLEPYDTSIVQLDRSNVKVIGKLKQVLIRLALNPQVHFIIDIIVADIPEAYGLFLSRDWSQKLDGYFATDWSHLWISHNGRPNKIRIDRERYMKHTVTEIDDSNEPVLFTDTIMGNYTADSFFGNLEAEISEIPDSNQQSKICHFTQVPPEIPVPDTSHLDLNNDLCSLYFDGSKSKEGAGAGCLLIDPYGKRYFIACRLEFDCTNNITEYEALIQGLKKAIDLGAKALVVLGDSEIIVR